MDISVFKVDVEKLKTGDRGELKKVVLYGAGVFGLVLLYRWWRGPFIDQKPSKGDELKDDRVPEGSLTLLTSALSDSQARAFAAALPDRAKQYAPMFVAAGRKYGVSPLVLAGIMYTETRYGAGCGVPGTTPLPQCRGMTKEDWGLMQINSVHKEFIRKTVNGRPAYEDPESVIMYGASVLRDSIRTMGRRNKSGVVKVSADRARRYGCASSGLLPDGRPVTGMAQLRAGIAGYNAGPGYPIMALACRVDPDVVTHDGKYGATALGEANRILAAMKATGVA